MSTLSHLAAALAGYLIGKPTNTTIKGSPHQMDRMDRIIQQLDAEEEPTRRRREALHKKMLAAGFKKSELSPILRYKDIVKDDNEEEYENDEDVKDTEDLTEVECAELENRRIIGESENYIMVLDDSSGQEKFRFIRK